MELFTCQGYYVTYQKQGNNKEGNPIYLINIFKCLNNSNFLNMNIKSKRRLDKHGNIKLSTYNVIAEIEAIIDTIE